MFSLPGRRMRITGSETKQLMRLCVIQHHPSRQSINVRTSYSVATTALLVLRKLLTLHHLSPNTIDPSDSVLRPELSNRFRLL